jgi:hypothetical protein
MYSLESLKPLNAVFDSEHRLKPRDVEMVNHYVELIKATRGERPCPGDIIEYTDEYGDYDENAHIRAFDNETGRFSIRICPHVPIVYRDGDKQEVGFYHTGGGLVTAVDAAPTYIGKREKMFAVFGHCILPARSTIYFKATVNVWEHITPNQRYPGYSTKDWRKQYVTYVENPVDGSPYHYYGSFNSGIVFRNVMELNLWKRTYKAVEFPGDSPNQTVLFLYRKADRLVSRKEWDALDLPLDTRFVNGIIHVKIDCNDNTHMVTVYRFTNSGYLDPKRFGPYEKAKGAALVAPGAEIKEKEPV